MEETLFVNGFRYFVISSCVTILVALFLNHICKRIITRFNKKYQDKVTTNQYLYHTIRAIIWLIAFIIIMRQISPLHTLGTTLLGATSIIAIAIGIAAQTTFGNYIAGVFLAVHQPFKVGDIIRLKEKNLSGTVEQITFRHTILRTQEHTEIIIPNTLMNTAIIEDMSNGHYSELIELKVANTTDLKKLQELINQLLKEEVLINKNEDVKLIVKDLTKDYYVVAFPIYTTSLQDFGQVKNNLLPKLAEELIKKEIQLY